MPIMRVMGIAGALALALSACDATQLVVIVDSDLAELDEVEVAVSMPTGLAATRRFEVASTGLPFSFGVAPGSGQAGEVELSAMALDANGHSLTAYHVRTRFLEGRTLRLEVPLARACIQEPGCADDAARRCVHGACLDEEVDPASLAEGDGPPAPLFEGREPPDAGAPPPDAGCAQDAPCLDPTNPCRLGVTRCAPERCELDTTLAPGTPCGDGRVCDAEGRCGA